LEQDAAQHVAGDARHTARHIGITDDGDSFVDDGLAGNGQFAVAAVLGCEVDDHGTRLHERDHVLEP